MRLSPDSEARQGKAAGLPPEATLAPIAPGLHRCTQRGSRDGRFTRRVAAAELQHGYRPCTLGLYSTQGPRLSGTSAYLSAFLPRGAGSAHSRSISPHLPLGEDVVSLCFSEFVCGLSLWW